MANQLIILSGPSGSGKTSIAKVMLNTFPQLSFSISATTRKQRDNETNGKDYYFLCLPDFKSKISKAEFIEYEEVYQDIFYGTLKVEIERIWKNDMIPLLDIDVMGALNVKEIYGVNALTIFIHPGNVDNLKTRLINRKSENAEALAKRIGKAETELAYAPKFDRIVVNDGELESALQKTAEVILDFVSK